MQQAAAQHNARRPVGIPTATEKNLSASTLRIRSPGSVCNKKQSRIPSPLPVGPHQIAPPCLGPTKIFQPGLTCDDVVGVVAREGEKLDLFTGRHHGRVRGFFGMNDLISLAENNCFLFLANHILPSVGILTKPRERNRFPSEFSGPWLFLPWGRHRNSRKYVFVTHHSVRKCKNLFLFQIRIKMILT